MPTYQTDSTHMAQDANNDAIQCLAPRAASGQVIVFSSGSSTAAAANITSTVSVIRVVATAPCYFSMKPTASPAALATDMYLAAGVPEYFRVPWEDAGAPGTLRAAAFGVSSGGSLYIHEMQ